MTPWISDVLLRSQTDERLAGLTRDGSERAFSILVERHRRPLVRYARRLAGATPAEDVVQQALMSAWAALRRGSEVEHVRGWLHQIVRRAAARAAQHDVPTDELPAGLVGSRGSDADLQPRIDVEDIVVAVNALPERQRIALVRSELEGRRRLEIAEEMNLSEGSVRQLLHRARAGLRTAMTAITPLPLVTWAATRTPADAAQTVAAERIAEITAGAGATGGVATALKAGTVAIVAAGAVAATTGLPPEDGDPRPGAVTQTALDRPDGAVAWQAERGPSAPGAALMSTSTQPRHRDAATRRDHEEAAGDDHRDRRTGADDRHEDDGSGGRGSDRTQRDRDDGNRSGSSGGGGQHADEQDAGTQDTGAQDTTQDTGAQDTGEPDTGRQDPGDSGSSDGESAESDDDADDATASADVDPLEADIADEDLER